MIARRKERLFALRKCIEKLLTWRGFRSSSFFLADLYDRTGRKEKLSTLSKSYCPGRDDYMAYNNIGCIYEEKGEDETALRLFEQSIAIEGEYYRSHFNRGVALNKLGRRKDALHAYRKSLDLWDGFADTFLNMSAIYLESGKLREAIAILDEGIEANAGAVNLYYNRACAYARLGEEKQARQDLKRSVELDESIVEYARKDPDFEGMEGIRRDLSTREDTLSTSRQEKR